jgi:putative flippase GtrA
VSSPGPAVSMLEKLSVTGSDFHQLLRFIIVGMLNTAFGYAVFAIIYLLTRAPVVAIVMGTIIGVIFNFFTTGRIVFENNQVSRLIPFALNYAVTCVLNILLFKFLQNLGLQVFIAQFVCLPPMVLIAFVLNRKFVFGRRR